MKYVIVKVDDKYTAPSPVNWFGTLDRKSLRKNRITTVTDRLFFSVEKHMQMTFTDIITFPCFMVSKVIRDVILKYDPSLKFKKVILFDREYNESMEYHIPFLEEIDIQTEKDKIKNKEIMEISDNNHTHILMRMDLVESILSRNVTGVGLDEFQV